MSNLWTPGGGEPSLGGNPLGGLGNVNTEGPRQQISAVTDALNALKSALRDTAWYSVGNSITSMLEGVSRSAKDAADNLKSVNTAASHAASSGGGGASAPAGGGGNANWLSAATSSAGAATAAAGGAAAAAGGGMAPAGIDISGQVLSRGGNYSNEDLTKSMALFPLRFMRSMMDMNRGNALTTSSAMGMQGYATGVSNADQMTMLSRLPGSVRGSQADILSLFANAPQFGAMFGMGAQPNAPRARGYLESVRQMQAMNPGAPVAEMAGTVGGFAANTAAQQQSQMMTGGAFGMIRPGGGMKTVQEWAESILRWLEQIRPGGKRGKGFTYGDLISQYFPGSNIDAWFEVQGVPQNMREYFWTYALGKTKSAGANTQDQTQTIGADTTSIAYQRLAATTSMTQSQFKLGGQMAGAYANREQANRWFNDLMGSFLNRVIPSATSQGAMQFAQYLPDTIEQTLMTIIENSGSLGTIFGGIAGYGGAFGGGGGGGALSSTVGNYASGIMGVGGIAGGIANVAMGGNSPLSGGNILQGAQSAWNWAFGDVGDIGDIYTSTGGTGTAGLHPDMRRRVGAMMRANPKLRVNSGLRDNAMQQRLKKQGVGRVSGRPSAHTRGMAADLGPASQYSWITQNASKFGLNSGISHGEPWHVGMGDIDDIFGAGGDFLTDMLSGMKNLFTGGDPAKGVAGMITPFFELLGGLMSSGEVDPSKLAFQSDLYERMHGMTAGGITLGGGIMGAIRKAAGNVGIASVGGTPGRAVASVLTPAEEMQSFQSSDQMTRGVAVVKALYQAGFRGDQLSRMAAISWHESRWTPSAWSPATDPDDIGGGLFAINQKPWIDKGQTPPWTREEIQDPWRSAQIAWEFYNDRGYQPWTTRNKPVDLGNQARQAAGLGDIEGMEYTSMMPSASSGGRSLVTFNNAFNISGGAGGAGGIDLRRTVSTIADHLESEMKQRMVRMN